MLSIHDEEIRTLAEAVMKRRGAPNVIAAIKLALQNQVRRADEAAPLRDRVAALRDEARAMADRPALPPLAQDERDSLWGLRVSIETSAIVAILAEETEADRFLDLIEQAGPREAGAHVRLGATIDLARILGLSVPKAQSLFDRFIAAADIAIPPLTDAIARRAVEAFDLYGKGRGHPARLNFGDCLSYACAASRRSPILLKGRDFARADLEPAFP